MIPISGSAKFRCQPFSTYPRTYDLLHANRLFSSYRNREEAEGCLLEDIMLEMDRIIRPQVSDDRSHPLDSPSIPNNLILLHSFAGIYYHQR